MATTKKPSKQSPFFPQVGSTVIIRTVTHFYTGKIEKLYSGWISLSSAAWIADTGRWNKALVSGELSEVEPFPNGVCVALGSVVDCSPWNHALPVAVK